MLRWIIKSSLKFRFLVIAIAVGLIYFGIGQLQKMPVDVFPEFAPPMVEVQTISLGLSQEEVESLVTIPLEQVLAGIPGMTVLRSKSVPDLSAIKMYFAAGTDLLLARQMVNERLATVVPILPTWASPPIMLPPLSATSRMMKIGITSKTRSVVDLSMITYWTIQQRIKRVPGVANVAIWGERIEMLQVNVVPELMKKHKVTMNEVMEATAEALDVGLFQFSDGHFVGSGGWIDTPNQRLQVRHILPIAKDYENITTKELAEVPLAVRDGKQLRLKDVAEVVMGHQPMVGEGIVNDGIGLMCIVEKFPWGNTLQVTKAVEEAIDALRPGLPDVEIDTAIFRPATFIETSIDNLSMALFIGSVLLILVLFFFLYNWRVALISCVAMPLSLLAAALVLYMRDTTINVMILAGFVIALGDIVDDAIIDIENVVRRLREYRQSGRTDKSLARIILDASIEVRGAIIYATLIEVLAIMPVFFLKGLSGAFFQPLALSYALALLVSMIVALTVTPALAMIFLRKAPLAEREAPIVRGLKKVYEKILTPIIRSPRPAFATVAVIMLSGILIWPRLGHSLLPSFKERDFLMHWLTKPGTSWPEMQRISIQSAKELLAIPGVLNLGSHIGQALIMDEVVGMYFAEHWVSVDPKVDYDKTLAKITEVVDGYPGVYRDVQTYLKERIREVLTGTSEAIVVRIFGQDLSILEAKAGEVKEALSKIPGIVDLHYSFQEKIPEIQIKVDLAKAQKYGVKPGDVRRIATTMIAGEEAGDILIANRTYDVNVWSVASARNSLTDIKEMLIDIPAGGHVQLQDVADVYVAPTPNVINREHLKRRIDVGGSAKGRPLSEVYHDVQAALTKIDFPQEYYPVLLGEYTERQAAQSTLLWVSVIAAIGVFLLLVTSFGSVRLATLSFLTLPSALVGGVLAAWMGDGVVSLGSLVGFLTILGIAARNGIMLIEHYQHLERHEGETFGPKLVLRGALERISPIMMTALTTVFAIIPLVVAGNLPGHEIEHPMAVVIMGGIVTSTLLNIFVVPSLYLKFAKPAVNPAR
ncbi:MAG: efflux RND transporter permease subunit [bacterium]